MGSSGFIILPLYSANIPTMTFVAFVKSLCRVQLS